MKKVARWLGMHMYVAALLDKSDKGSVWMPTPPILIDIMAKYADLMPKNLPKVFPLRTIVDHRLSLS